MSRKLEKKMDLDKKISEDNTSINTSQLWSKALLYHASLRSAHDIFKKKFRKTYPTDKTLPVSFKSASAETPLIFSSKMEETSVGAALAAA